jgi:hypothetical protein
MDENDANISNGSESVEAEEICANTNESEETPVIAICGRRL